MTKKTLDVEEFKPKLNIEEFKALYKLLLTASNDNDSACARMLTINVQTWRKWYSHPPTMAHWPLILRHVIIQLLGSMKGRRFSRTNIDWTRIHDQLAKIPHHDQIELAMLEHFRTTQSAEDHLRRLLMGKNGMFWDIIQKAANAGGHSPRALQRASRALGIIKTVQGFGEDRRSYWRLPTLEALTIDTDEFGDETYETPLDEL